jgi:hypothetical protein
MGRAAFLRPQRAELRSLPKGDCEKRISGMNEVAFLATIKT